MPPSMVRVAKTEELPILPFSSPALFERWLFKHHHKYAGIWIKMAKKATGIPSVTHEQALDVALCHGWIDGQRKPCDNRFFLQKFTPRRTKSLWSKRNVAKVAQLISSKKMQPSGLAEVEIAKQDGRWQAAYDSSKEMEFPKDFLKALKRNKPAYGFFKTLNKSNVYAIAWRLATARKPEMRKRRFAALLARLERGEKLH